MERDTILNAINEFSDYQFNWSEPITDKEYLEEKGITNVEGHGIYDADAVNRYCLCIDIPNSTNKTLITLLMNPSNTFPPDIAKTKKTKKGQKVKSRYDQTIRNLIRLAYVKGYSQIVVLNTFPFIEGNSTNANKYAQKNKKLNSDFIEKVLNNSFEILVACGDNVKSDLYIEYFNIITGLKDNAKLYTYTRGNNKLSALTKNSRPRHLSLQSKANRILYEIALSNNELYELDIVNNHFILKD